MSRKLPPAQSDEAIAELVPHLLAGRVVDDFLVAERALGLINMVFVPIAWGACSGYSRAQLSRIVVFAIQGVDKTLGWYVNGWPMFAACRVWRLTDWQKALKLYAKAKAALDDVLAIPKRG